MSSPSPARVLELVAIEVAGLAADYVRAAAGSASSSGTKSSPTDVVTVSDLDSERLIRNELLARCPGSAIIGEEYGVAAGTNNVGWIVDPIDGTVNFLYDLSVVAVSIAATIDGVVVAGAVTDVHRRMTYSAAHGSGARRDGTHITAGAIDDLEQALIGTGFSYDSDIRAAEAATLQRVLPTCRDIRCMGSAALNLCWVADGSLDGFYERDLKIYDHAAGALVAAEAGATVEQPDDRGDLVIAAAGGIFSSLRELVADPSGV